MGLNQVEVDYKRYCAMQEFLGKQVPMFEDYLVSKGLDPKDYLNEEEYNNFKRRMT